MSLLNIYNKLKQVISNDFGVYGLLANLKAESGLKSNNLQNTFNKSLGMTDDEYTKAVDDGSYNNFIKDGAGYGLAQWTYWTRKQSLLNFRKNYNCNSISDEDMQVSFLIHELQNSYVSVLNALKSANSIKEASDIVLTQFEKPVDQSDSVKLLRASYGEEIKEEVEKLLGKGEEKLAYTNSSLVTCTVKSPNHSGTRTHKIDRITPHCVVGQLSASSIGGCFKSSSVKASCNYGIGTEGGVCLVVDEENRSWCSSSSDNDQRAITIECASDKSEPYAFNSIVYNKLVQLCADICKRNGKTKCVWFSNKTKALNYEPADDEMLFTVHRWFANKSCPGNWLYNRMSQLVSDVNNMISTGSISTNTGNSSSSYPKVPFSVKVLIDDLNYREQPNMQGKVLGQTGIGSFTISEISGSWGKLKSGVGWIWLGNAEYVRVGSTVSDSVESTAKDSSVDSEYKVKVEIDDLYIRKGPGTNYKKVKFTGKGTFTVVEESDGKGATKWGLLKSYAASRNGWISLDYVTKV